LSVFVMSSSVAREKILRYAISILVGFMDELKSDKEPVNNFV